MNVFLFLLSFFEEGRKDIDEDESFFKKHFL